MNASSPIVLSFIFYIIYTLLNSCLLYIAISSLYFALKLLKMHNFFVHYSIRLSNMLYIMVLFYLKISYFARLACIYSSYYVIIYVKQLAINDNNKVLHTNTKGIVCMAKEPSNKNYLDYYTANNDYTGERNIDNEEELVEYKLSSSVRIWLNEQNINFSPHWHSALEIIMPMEQHYDVKVKELSFHVLPGEILIIPPGEIHSIYSPPTGKRFIFLFDISQLTSMKGFTGISSILAQPLYVTKETYPYIYDDVYQYLVQIRNEYFYKNEYAELSIYAMLLQMFVKFGYNHINTVNIFSNVRINKQKEYVLKFNEIMDYIDEHYMEDLSLESIAEQSGFSKYHFSRLFKLYTNFTFCNYLTYRRIKVAESLLIQPDLSITEVALQSGFPSISTFNRIFKQEKDCTPSEYRAKNNQVHFPKRNDEEKRD